MRKVKSMGTEDKRPVNAGKTNLMAACEQGRTLDVKIILQKKPLLVASKDRNGKTALHYSAESGSLPCVQLLVSADSTLVNAQDSEGFTPLHIAVITGHRTIVKFLLKHGSDPNATDKERHSSVHWASVCGDGEALDILLNHGADPSTADILGAYPIHYAAQMCGPQNMVSSDARVGIGILRKLVRKGASIQCRDRDGREPLLWAASTGSCEAVLLLFSSGANIMAPDKDGLTALHCAASRGHTSCVETLVTLCGAKVNGGDSLGCSSLFYSAAQGHADATHTLLKYGADPNLQDSKGRTAAHCAAGKGQWETMRILDSNGADLWIRNTRGNLPLHEAVQSGRKDLVQWLLQQNPKAVNATNMNGRTPLHITSQSNNVEMCEVLIEHGAFINPLMVNAKGFFMTPLDIAVHNGNQRCAKFVNLHGGIPATKVLENSEIDRNLLFSLGNYACSQKDRSDEDGISVSSFENIPRPAPTVTITKSHDHLRAEPRATATSDIPITPSESMLTNVTSEDPADASVHIHLTTDDLWTMWESLMQGFATETASGDTSPMRKKPTDDASRGQPIVTSVYLKKINSIPNAGEYPDSIKTIERNVRTIDRSGANVFDKKGEVTEYIVASIVGSRERETSKEEWLQRQEQRLEKMDAEERCTCSSHVSGMDSDSKLIDRRRRNIPNEVYASDSVGSDTEDIKECQAPKLIKLRKKKSDGRPGGRTLDESETSSGHKPEERIRYPYLKRTHQKKHPPKVNDQYVRLPELEDHIERPKEEEFQQEQATRRMPEINDSSKYIDKSLPRSSEDLAPIQNIETISPTLEKQKSSFPSVKEQEIKKQLPKPEKREETDKERKLKASRRKSMSERHIERDPTVEMNRRASMQHLNVQQNFSGKFNQYSSDASAMETDMTLQSSPQRTREQQAYNHFHHHHYHHHHHHHDSSTQKDSLRTLSPVIGENSVDKRQTYRQHHRRRSKHEKASSLNGRAKLVSDGEVLQQQESEPEKLLRSKSEMSVHHLDSSEDISDPKIHSDKSEQKYNKIHQNVKERGKKETKILKQEHKAKRLSVCDSIESNLPIPPPDEHELQENGNAVEVDNMPPISENSETTSTDVPKLEKARKTEDKNANSISLPSIINGNVHQEIIKDIPKNTNDTIPKTMVNEEKEKKVSENLTVSSTKNSTKVETGEAKSKELHIENESPMIIIEECTKESESDSVGSQNKTGKEDVESEEVINDQDGDTAINSDVTEADEADLSHLTDKIKEDKEKEDNGKEEKGKEDKGKEDKEKEDKGKEHNEKEDKGKEDKEKEDKEKEEVKLSQTIASNIETESKCPGENGGNMKEITTNEASLEHDGIHEKSVKKEIINPDTLLELDADIEKTIKEDDKNDDASLGPDIANDEIVENEETINGASVEHFDDEKKNMSEIETTDKTSIEHEIPDEKIVKKEETNPETLIELNDGNETDVKKRKKSEASLEPDLVDEKNLEKEGKSGESLLEPVDADEKITSNIEIIDETSPEFNDSGDKNEKDIKVIGEAALEQSNDDVKDTKDNQIISEAALELSDADGKDTKDSQIISEAALELSDVDGKDTKDTEATGEVAREPGDDDDKDKKDIKIIDEASLKPDDTNEKDAIHIKTIGEVPLKPGKTEDKETKDIETNGEVSLGPDDTGDNNIKDIEETNGEVSLGPDDTGDNNIKDIEETNGKVSLGLSDADDNNMKDIETNGEVSLGPDDTDDNNIKDIEETNGKVSLGLSDADDNNIKDIEETNGKVSLGLGDADDNNMKDIETIGETALECDVVDSKDTKDIDAICEDALEPSNAEGIDTKDTETVIEAAFEPSDTVGKDTKDMDAISEVALEPSNAEGTDSKDTEQIIEAAFEPSDAVPKDTKDNKTISDAAHESGDTKAHSGDKDTKDLGTTDKAAVQASDAEDKDTKHLETIGEAVLIPNGTHGKKINGVNKGNGLDLLGDSSERIHLKKCQKTTPVEITNKGTKPEPRNGMGEKKKVHHNEKTHSVENDSAEAKQETVEIKAISSSEIKKVNEIDSTDTKNDEIIKRTKESLPPAAGTTNKRTIRRKESKGAVNYEETLSTKNEKIMEIQDNFKHANDKISSNKSLGECSSVKKLYTSLDATRENSEMLHKENATEASCIEDSRAKTAPIQEPSDVTDRMVREKTFITSKHESSDNPKQKDTTHSNEKSVKTESAVDNKTIRQKRTERKHSIRKTIPTYGDEENGDEVTGLRDDEIEQVHTSSNTTTVHVRSVGTQVSEKSRTHDSKHLRAKKDCSKHQKSEKTSTRATGKLHLQVRFHESTSRKPRTRESYSQTKFRLSEPSIRSEDHQSTTRRSHKPEIREIVHPKPVLKLPKPMQGVMSQKSGKTDRPSRVHKESSIGTQTERIKRHSNKTGSKTDTVQAKDAVEDDPNDPEHLQKGQKNNLGAIFFIDKDSETENDQGTPRMHPRKSDNPFENYEFHRLNEKGELTLFCSSMNGNNQKELENALPNTSIELKTNLIQQKKQRQPQSNLDKPGFLWVHFGANSSPIHTLKKKPMLTSECSVGKASTSPSKQPIKSGKSLGPTLAQKQRHPIRKASQSPVKETAKKPARSSQKEYIKKEKSALPPVSTGKTKIPNTSPKKSPSKAIHGSLNSSKKNKVGSEESMQINHQKQGKEQTEESGKMSSSGVKRDTGSAPQKPLEISKKNRNLSLPVVHSIKSVEESLMGKPKEHNSPQEINGCTEIPSAIEVEREVEIDLTIQNDNSDIFPESAATEDRLKTEDSIEKTRELDMQEQEIENYDEKDEYLTKLFKDSDLLGNSVDNMDEVETPHEEKQIMKDHAGSRNTSPNGKETELELNPSANDLKSDRPSSPHHQEDTTETVAHGEDSKSRGRDKGRRSTASSMSQDRESANQSIASSTKSTSTEEGELKLIIERKTDPEFSIKIKVADPNKKNKMKADPNKKDKTKAEHQSESEISSLKDSSGYVSAVESIYNNRRNFTIDVGHTTAKINTKLPKYDPGATDNSSGVLDVNSDGIESSPAKNRRTSNIPQLPPNLIGEMADVHHHPLYNGRQERDLTIVNLARIEYFHSQESVDGVFVKQKPDLAESPKLPLLESTSSIQNRSPTLDPVSPRNSVDKVVYRDEQTISEITSSNKKLQFSPSQSLRQQTPVLHGRKTSGIPIARTYSEANIRSPTKFRRREEINAQSKSMTSLREEDSTRTFAGEASHEVTINAKTQHLISPRSKNNFGV